MRIEVRVYKTDWDVGDGGAGGKGVGSVGLTVSTDKYHKMPPLALAPIC